MLPKKRNPNWLNSINFRINTPEGPAYIEIWEKDVGVIDRVIMRMGKGGSALSALCYGISELVTKSLLKGDSISDIILTLSGITTDRSIKVRGSQVHSPIDALLLALMQYRSGVPSDLEEEEKLSKHLKVSR